MTTPPFDWAEAREASREAARAQESAEQGLKDAFRQYAEAEENYRIGLAKKLVELHEQDGLAWTVCADVARGDPEIAELRRHRDIAEGVREACKQAAWRMAANRRDTEGLINWSARRELAENPPVRSVA